jgi:hypothetical protein
VTLVNKVTLSDVLRDPIIVGRLAFVVTRRAFISEIVMMPRETRHRRERRGARQSTDRRLQLEPLYARFDAAQVARLCRSVRRREQIKLTIVRQRCR